MCLYICMCVQVYMPYETIKNYEYEKKCIYAEMEN